MSSKIEVLDDSPRGKQRDSPIKTKKAEDKKADDKKDDGKQTITLDELNTMIAADEKTYVEKEKEYNKIKFEISKLKEQLVQKHEELLEAYKTLTDKRMLGMNSLLQTHANRVKELEEAAGKKKRDDNLA